MRNLIQAVCTRVCTVAVGMQYSTFDCTQHRDNCCLGTGKLTQIHKYVVCTEF